MINMYELWVQSHLPFLPGKLIERTECESYFKSKQLLRNESSASVVEGKRLGYLYLRGKTIPNSQPGKNRISEWISMAAVFHHCILGIPH